MPFSDPFSEYITRVKWTLPACRSEQSLPWPEMDPLPCFPIPIKTPIVGFLFIAMATGKRSCKHLRIRSLAASQILGECCNACWSAWHWNPRSSRNRSGRCGPCCSGFSGQSLFIQADAESFMACFSVWNSFCYSITPSTASSLTILLNPV